MTHPIYSSSTLAQLSASELKQIASDLGAALTLDERDFWLNCILAHQSGIIQAFNTVPASLIEEKTLELLGVLVVDRQDESDFVVPHGDIRFWVHRFDELIGTISTWVIGGVDTYHPTEYSNPNKFTRCNSLFDAVRHLLPKQELEITYRDAFNILNQRFNSTPDYM